MYSEIKHVFFSAMSNPDKGEDININFQIVKRPSFKFLDETVSNNSESLAHHQEQEKKEEGEEQRRIEFEAKLPEVGTSSSLREQEEIQLEDGFRTPTSLDHRIPVAKQCPPAPRKPKASRKRKPSSQTSCSCRHPLDLSIREVEFDLLFPIQHNPLSDSNQNAKRVRREDPK
ncbi:hypothetical protein L6164_003307 [Bauhinia variegata]|uniref:Uncharacterized protein n=1 Tax=Bauhinia variegata TaxID=167791 RepID=A0ACB9Q0B7_BAUVA|nr:hypothetical protein L6164_003307 [Bauhinia variegata]